MKRILIVDDQVLIRKLITLTLGKKYHIVEASNTDEASLMLEQEAPDLVVLDIMMPGINGLEWLAMVKRHNKNPSLKIILLSARGQTADIHLGLATGADAYITKPFSPIDLISKISTLCIE